MATAVKRKLSGSTDGRGILLQTLPSGSSTGNLIHTAVVGTTPGTFDEIWVWAQNTYTSDIPLSVQFGSSSVSGSIVATIPWQSGLVPIVPGLILQNSLTVNAYAASGSVVTLYGFVNSITD